VKQWAGQAADSPPLFGLDDGLDEPLDEEPLDELLEESPEEELPEEELPEEEPPEDEPPEESPDEDPLATVVVFSVPRESFR
jgi:hypothetical protein